MRLKDLTYKELVDKILDITNELSDRFQKEPKNSADEFVGITDLELSVGSLRTILERQGKIT